MRCHVTRARLLSYPLPIETENSNEGAPTTGKALHPSNPFSGKAAFPEKRPLPRPQLAAGLEQTMYGLGDLNEVHSACPHLRKLQGIFGNMSYFPENGQVFRKTETLISSSEVSLSPVRRHRARGAPGAAAELRCGPAAAGRPAPCRCVMDQMVVEASWNHLA